MTWLYCSVVSILGFALWGFLGKIALREASWVELTAFYGVALVIAAAIVGLSGRHEFSWSPIAVGVGALSAVCGAVAVIALYVALERGSVSLVLPLAALYPVVGVVLGVAFLGERLNAVQALGIALALGGGVLVAAAS
jgi:transporter family protein